MSFLSFIARRADKIAVLFLLVFSLSFAVMPTLAFDGGLNETVNVPIPAGENNLGALTAQADQPIEQRVGALIGTILSYIGVIFFVLIVYGGFQWMTAQGNDQKVGKAKELIINATIGLVIVLSAYAITSFIGTSLTSE